MTDVEFATSAYLELAESLHDGWLAEADLAAAVRSLPALNRPLLEALAEKGAPYRRRRPRRGWALAAVVDAAAGRVGDAFLQGLAAWHLADAANEWVRPGRVEEAANRAYRLFKEADKPAWAAAATFQRNALPWTRHSFAQARDELKDALAALESTAQEEGSESPFTRLAFRCRLSLAHAQLLTGDYEIARENAKASERFFRRSPHHDLFYLGRCHFVQAAIYRRGSQMEEAASHTEQAVAIFDEIDARSFAAQAMCQRGYNQLQAKTEYEEALATFTEAAARSTELDIPLWEAQCAHGKAQTYIATGRLANARRSLQEARAVYERYDVPGPLSGALLDSGWLEMLYGNFQDSLTHFSDAQALAERTDNRLLSALTDMHRAKAHVPLGRYQYALTSLEKAEETLADLGLPNRQAECELRLADVWSQLGKPARAHAYLDQAIGHFEEAKRAGVLAYVYTRRAEILFGEGQIDEALTFLQKSLAEAEARDDQPIAARARRYLGEALCAAGRSEEASDRLQAAEAAYRRMHMSHEQAACQVALGHCYQRKGRETAARRAWRRALDLSAGAMSDVIWQSHAGLARLAETEGDQATALTHYRQVVKALERLRRRTWQPTLVDAFLRRPSAALDRAVALAARLDQSQETLSFIEASKAQTVARQILNERQQQSLSQSGALQEMAAEIRWLNEEIQASVAQHKGWKRPPREGELRRRLHHAVQEYDRLSARLERSAAAGEAASPPADFTMDALRRHLDAALGGRWLALNYYRMDQRLICVALTADDCRVATTKLSPQAYGALERFGRSGRSGEALQPQDLLSLGTALIPEAMRPLLRPDAHLVIVPHRELHHLPWAALCLPPDERPLAACCIPVLSPSLHTLALLAQRPGTAAAATRHPLVLAVSDFQGRHSPLPAVRAEVDALLAILGPDTTLLADEEATWPAIQRLTDGAELRRYTLLHVASHAFHDPLSGRLSGMAFYDQDIWLEDLKQCAPPPVVTLSACSGSVSRIFEGDEHVSVPTTCLAAGAQSVVGSIWPVPDAETANLIPNVYENLAGGATVAEALARAQRAAWERGLPLSHWAGFRCTGLPAP
ncbi:MAG: CHAT domain-containing protein [Candidatus Promineifilaceae bacterium]|nr:CHAT domain-containing protein [Candidatus Promineifilaceae bacterium]